MSGKRQRTNEEKKSPFSSIKSKKNFEEVFGKDYLIEYSMGCIPQLREQIPYHFLKSWIEYLGSQLAIAHKHTLQNTKEASYYPQTFIFLCNILGLLSNSTDFSVSIDFKMDVENEEEGENEEEEEEEAETEIEKPDEEVLKSPAVKGKNPKSLVVHEEISPVARESKAEAFVVGLEENLKSDRLVCTGTSEFVISQLILPASCSSSSQPAAASTATEDSSKRRIRRVVIEAKRSITNKEGLYQLFAELIACAQLNGDAQPVYGFLTDFYDWIFVCFDGKKHFQVWERFTAFSSVNYRLVPKVDIRQLVIAFLCALDGLPQNNNDLSVRTTRMKNARETMGKEFLTNYEDAHRELAALIEANTALAKTVAEKDAALIQATADKDEAMRIAAEKEVEIITNLKLINKFSREQVLGVLQGKPPANFDALWNSIN